ncbi:hypothetical protein F4781DRAFT_90423 [Annulohypoxylon bovei var. microspora]|nr:hypothetical protein F4781DRAFT_90423 [Annulohypoxylon bovei var. microspora]
MAASSFKHNIYLPNTCSVPSSPSHLSIPIISVPADARLSGTSERFNRESSKPSRPTCRYAKANLREETLTSQILRRIFNIPRPLPFYHSSRLSHLQLLKKSRKLLSTARLDKNNFLPKPTAVLGGKRKESAPAFAAFSKFDMTTRHSIVACKAVSSRPITIVATSYDVDNQLRNDVISDNENKYYSTNPDLPDEGVFIIYRNRALQIAAPPCDQRKCNTSQLCRCHNSQFSTQGALLCHQTSKKGGVRWPIRKPCSHCLFNWLHLYQATETANKLNMKCLQHPRSLTLATLHGQEAFYYDGEIEEQYVHSQNNGKVGKSTNGKSSCPPRVFEWMTDAWNDFTNCCCCKTGSITSLSDAEGDTHNEECSGSEQGESDNDWDWDDLDIPCKRRSTSSISECDDYDFIEDLIDKEFPKLQKRRGADIDVGSQSKAELYPVSISDIDSNEEDDDPVPIITPPKNMVIGQGLRTSTDLAPSILIPARNGSLTTIPDSRHMKSQRSFGTKRSYFDLVRSGQCDPQSEEGLSRAKQRKLDLAVTESAYRCREDFTVHEPFSKNHILQKLVPV